MTREIEDIIKNKAFDELTVDERKRVGELAENEEEYAAMQWFLLAAGASFQATKITASPKVKTRVMEHLTTSANKKGFWLNSVGVFMLPQGKPLYKKPAFQLAIAATFVIGFLFYFNQALPNNELALNNTVPEQNDQTKPLDANPSQSELNNQLESGQVATRFLDSSAQSASDEGLFPSANFSPQANMNESPRLVSEFNDLSQMESEASAEEIQVVDFLKADAALEEKSMLTDEAVSEEINRIEQTKKRNEIIATDNEVSEKDRNKAKAETNSFSFDLTAAAPAGIDNSNEEITPKALHIDKTKELNQLFFIAK